MKRKKLIALLPAMSTIVALSACGGNNSAGTPPPSAADANPSALSASDPLVVWAWDDAFNVPAMQDAINLYIAQRLICISRRIVWRKVPLELTIWPLVTWRPP